jgi:hypothetical protein
MTYTSPRLLMLLVLVCALVACQAPKKAPATPTTDVVSSPSEIDEEEEPSEEEESSGDAPAGDAPAGDVDEPEEPVDPSELPAQVEDDTAEEPPEEEEPSEEDELDEEEGSDEE